MRGEHLLRLYPRPWRERDGQDLLATVGPDPLRARDVMDIVLGALDAWCSTDVRRVTVSRAAARQGGLMSLSGMVCDRNGTSVTPRDGLVGAVVMLASSFAFRALAHASQGSFPLAGSVLTNLSFLGPLTLSMPFWLMKGQPWRAQAIIVGGTLAVLLLIG